MRGRLTAVRPVQTQSRGWSIIDASFRNAGSRFGIGHRLRSGFKARVNAMHGSPLLPLRRRYVPGQARCGRWLSRGRRPRRGPRRRAQDAPASRPAVPVPVPNRPIIASASRVFTSP